MVARPIMWIKIGHLTGESKWDSMHSNELDIEGLKASQKNQKNELVVLGQNIFSDFQIYFSQREGLSECRQLRNETYILGLGCPEDFKAFV